jgi:hypothetical protein
LFGLVDAVAAASCGHAASFDKFLDPRSKLMSSDLVGVHEELAKDDLDASVAASVEALGVSEQFEGVFEELSSGVGRPVRDLSPIAVDHRCGGNS